MGLFLIKEALMKELKKALTFDEQVERLSNFHKLTIEDREKAIEILQKVNYYRLSAYGIGLKDRTNQEEYSAGISLEHIFRLYLFDSKFKNILLHIIEQIEVQLRTQISNHLALRYGPEGYKDPKNFISKTSRDGNDLHCSIINNFQRECERQKNVPFVKHHIEKYENHFPIWVAVELFTFGNLSSLFDIMSSEDRKQIASFYNTEDDYLGSWILALVEVRNICAHYGRLYNMPLKQTPFLYSEYKKYRNPQNNKVFPLLLIIKRTLQNDDRWKNFFCELEALIDSYSDVIIFPYMGFPCNWKEILGS